MNEHLLSSVQMAQFVSSGFLKFDEMISRDLCAACLVEMRDNTGYLAVGTPFEDTWPQGTALGDVFRLPQVRGLIHSLVGPDPLYDHHAAHLTPAGVMKGPNTHQDSVIDFRENYFDIHHCVAVSFFLADHSSSTAGCRQTKPPVTGSRE